jgi:hypothetical protein
MTLRLWPVGTAALLVALTVPAADSLGDSSLGAVLDELVEQLTASQREPLAALLAEPQQACESGGNDQACALVALRELLLRSGAGIPLDAVVAPPADPRRSIDADPSPQ